MLQYLITILTSSLTKNASRSVRNSVINFLDVTKEEMNDKTAFLHLLTSIDRIEFSSDKQEHNLYKIVQPVMQ